MTAWTNGHQIWCTTAGQHHTWPAADIEAAAAGLAALARPAARRLTGPVLHRLRAATKCSYDVALTIAASMLHECGSSGAEHPARGDGRRLGCARPSAWGTAMWHGGGSSAVSVRFAWRVMLVVHPGVSRRAPDGPADHHDGTLPWSRPRRWGIAVVAGSGCGSGGGPAVRMRPLRPDGRVPAAGPHSQGATPMSHCGAQDNSDATLRCDWCGGRRGHGGVR